MQQYLFPFFFFFCINIQTKQQSKINPCSSLQKGRCLTNGPQIGWPTVSLVINIKVLLQEPVSLDSGPCRYGAISLKNHVEQVADDCQIYCFYYYNIFESLVTSEKDVNLFLVNSKHSVILRFYPKNHQFDSTSLRFSLIFVTENLQFSTLE